MQTFMPYKSFRESAKCLDMKRLGMLRKRLHAMNPEVYPYEE